MASKRPANRKPVRRKKKKTSALTVALSVILVLLLTAGGVVAWYAVHSLNKIKRVDTDKEVWISSEYETFETDEPAETASMQPEQENTLAPEEIVWEKPKEVVKESHIHNILLIGQDRRPGEGRARSDSMIICSINEETREIRLCSLMRDLYVPFPGDFSDNRINAAYTFGGMSLLDQLIEEDFGITIDGNVEVDFNGFISVMDLVAPLEIELTDAEAWYMNQGTDWMLRAGVNSLNGEQLLTYARIRYIGNGDFERTERQRKVLNKAFSKVRDFSVAQITDLANAALPCVTTDLTNSEILKYAYIVGANRLSIAGNYRIPADGTYVPQMIRGMSVLVPDLRANSDLLKQYLRLK